MLILADHKLSQSVAYKGKAEGWNVLMKGSVFLLLLTYALFCGVKQLNFALTMKIAQL